MGIKRLILNITLSFLKCFLVFFKINSKKISFVSLESTTLTEDFKLIAEMLEKENKYELHYELFKFEKTLIGYAKYFFECIKLLFVINTSALVILDYNNYVVSHFKSEKVKVLQIWHASGAIKKFGNLVERDFKINNYDYAIVNSDEFVETFSAAFNIDKEHICTTGIPKTDVLFDRNEMSARREAFIKQHSEITGKKIVLYAPTFRGRLMTGFKDVYLDIKRLKKELGEEYVVLYRLHPLVQKELAADIPGVICCNSDDLYTLMEVSDLLISDYSALIIDYSVYHKPIVFYVPDIDEYRVTPGLALEYEKEMPGPICKSEAEVVTAIRQSNVMKYDVAGFQRKYFPFTDGRSTERVTAFISGIVDTSNHKSVRKLMIAFIKVGIAALNIIYCLFKMLPTQKKVVMLSRQSNTPSEEFKMVKEEIQKRDKDVSVVVLCKTLDDGINSSLYNKVRYALHMLTQMYHIATSKIAVLDSYCIVISILKHKKTLKVIQMWHSMGTMKKFGYTTLGTEEGSSSELAYAMKMHQNYDYVFASAEAYKQHLADGFECDIEKIITMPLPRYDLLISKTYEEKVQAKISSRYPGIMDKPVIVYCPTFRKDETAFETAVQKLVDAVDTEKYNLVVKLHPLSKVVLSEDVIQMKEFTSFDLLFVADYVISDYSCIVYEAAVRNIPLYFYNFDMELYETGRGLAIDYNNELPGIISKDAKEIADAIEKIPYDKEELKAFSHKYVVPVESATRDIVDFIWRFM